MQSIFDFCFNEVIITSSLLDLSGVLSLRVNREFHHSSHGRAEMTQTLTPVEHLHLLGV